MELQKILYFAAEQLAWLISGGILVAVTIIITRAASTRHIIRHHLDTEAKEHIRDLEAENQRLREKLEIVRKERNKLRVAVKGAAASLKILEKGNGAE